MMHRLVSQRTRRHLHPAAFLFLTVASLVGVVFQATGSDSNSRIHPWKENRHYWEYKGQPILLLGGSDEDNLFNNPPLMRNNFQTMEKCGANYIRCTLSCRDKGNVWPFAQKNGHYDLNTLNPEFWNRLEICIQEAEKRDVIVQIEFWATFDYYRDIWLKNPFNPANNTNYTSKNTRLIPAWNYHPAAKVQPFFFSIPGKNNDRKLLKYQEAFVRKVLEISLPYPNVLYCLDNETRAPEEWAVYWGQFIKKESQKRGAVAQVTEMWDPWNVKDECHRRTYSHSEVFSYTDISQNNWQVGQTHYDRIMWYRNALEHQAGGIRPINNVKVYAKVANQPNLDSTAVSVDRWWQNIFAGCASTRFHRPTAGLGLSPKAQKTIHAARIFTSAFDIFHSAPHPDLLSNRESNEAYCLAISGMVYAIYFPKGGQVDLDIGKSATPCTLRWFDPETATFHNPEKMETRGTKGILRSPNTKQTWLVLVEAPK